MENVTGGRRGIAAAESGIRDRTTPEGTASAASGIAELERMVERQTAVIAELRADLEEGNAKLAVPDAECRRARGGKGENGIRRSGGDAKVLRDELARQTAENMRKDRVVERQTAVIAELRMEIERFGVETGQVREQGKAPQADRARRIPGPWLPGCLPSRPSATDTGRARTTPHISGTPLPTCSCS